MVSAPVLLGGALTKLGLQTIDGMYICIFNIPGAPLAFCKISASQQPVSSMYLGLLALFCSALGRLLPVVTTSSI